MALDTLSSNDFLNFMIYDTISASSGLDLSNFHANNNVVLETSSNSLKAEESQEKKQKMGKKRKRRKSRGSKNKEEAESQRMTHITVERNRRKQMNEHLSVLRSLMPPSYAQRGDQASIVGGAIEYVKELEQLLQSLEARKLQLQQGHNAITEPPFSQFFMSPQYTWSQLPNSHSSSAVADIEVTLVETHANLRILTRTTTPSHITLLISGIGSLFLTILHFNVTTLHPLVLYSISAKLEEQCQLTSVEDIAAAVHQILRIIEEGTVLA